MAAAASSLAAFLGGGLALISTGLAGKGRDIMPLDDTVSLLRDALIGLGLVFALGAPFFARILHWRYRTPITRRSVILSTLGIECAALGAFCGALELQFYSNRTLLTALVIAIPILFLAYIFLLVPAYAGPRRRPPARQTGNGDSSPEETP